MTLIDSSVWIGFLRGTHEDVEAVSSMVRGTNSATLCGPVLQEVLQGVRDGRQRKELRDYLLRLPMVDTVTEHYINAAEAYANLRKRGITVPSTDVLIAAIASAAGHEILTHDRHFLEIEKEMTIVVSIL